MEFGDPYKRETLKQKKQQRDIPEQTRCGSLISQQRATNKIQSKNIWMEGPIISLHKK